MDDLEYGVRASLQQHGDDGYSEASRLRLSHHLLEVADEVRDAAAADVGVPGPVIHHQEVGVVWIQRRLFLRLYFNIRIVANLSKIFVRMLGTYNSENYFPT